MCWGEDTRLSLHDLFKVAHLYAPITPERITAQPKHYERHSGSLKTTQFRLNSNHRGHSHSSMHFSDFSYLCILFKP